jgi:hypothetical protein
MLSPFIMEAKQFLVSPPLKLVLIVFQLTFSKLTVLKMMLSDTSRHLQRPDASGRRSKVSYVPSESERIYVPSESERIDLK